MSDSISKRLDGLKLPKAPFGEKVWMATQRILALGLFVGSLPLLAVLYVVVRTTSRGPFIYRQIRPGIHGRPIAAQPALVPLDFHWRHVRGKGPGRLFRRRLP